MRRSYLAAVSSKVPQPGERLGAIDVGSNSIRLLVAEFDPQGGIKVIDEVKDQPRLAAGIAESNRLDEFAMARAIQTLGRMREVAERRGVRRILAVATSAVREAENGKAFVERVRREVGIPLKIIDTEGRVVPREELYQTVWGAPMRSSDRSVDVYVHKLRAKLANALPQWQFIHTHFGFGYRFEPCPPENTRRRNGR